MKIFEILGEVTTHGKVNYDNSLGLGAVPDNANIAYKGLNVLMKPTVFLKLAHVVYVDALHNLKYIRNHIKAGEAIGTPWLQIDLMDDHNGNPIGKGAKVDRHEGRHRMYAICELHGDEPVPVHLFFTGLRARHITPEIIKDLNDHLISQDRDNLTGPFFTIP